MSAETDNMEMDDTPESVGAGLEDSPEPENSLEPENSPEPENSLESSGSELAEGADHQVESVAEDPDEENEPGIQRLKEAPLIPVIEAALMAAGKPLTLEHLAGLFDEDARPSKPELRQAMIELGELCTDRGFELKEIASGWRFQVRQELAPWVGRLWEEKPQRYTRALLETLALIAYRQPITRSEIEDIRGVSVSTNIVRTLQEREWVRVVGHRDVPGRPAMYATTRQFLDYFNLRNLDELPPLSELRDLDEMARKLEGGLEGGSEQPEPVLDENGEPMASPPPAAGGEPSQADGDEASGDETAGTEDKEWSASRLVSVEEAQAFQEEGDGNIEKLFSELDDMESGLTLTYTDYNPLAEEDNQDSSSGSSSGALSEVVATVDVTFEPSADVPEEQEGQNDNSSSDDGRESDS